SNLSSLPRLRDRSGPDGIAAGGMPFRCAMINTSRYERTRTMETSRTRSDHSDRIVRMGSEQRAMAGASARDGDTVPPRWMHQRNGGLHAQWVHCTMEIQLRRCRPFAGVGVPVE